MAVYTEIRIRRDKAANWEATNPRLALGEIAADITNQRLKVGNGIDRWNELPYVNKDLYDGLDSLTEETAAKIRELSASISSNENKIKVLDAQQKVTDSTLSTTRTELSSTASRLDTKIDSVLAEASSKVTNLKDYTDSEIKKSEARSTEKIEGTSSTLTTIAEAAKAEASRAATEVSAAHAEFVSGIEGVKGEQATLSRQNETLSARFDEVLSGATEDGEILDARIDADGNTHSTLGENVRGLQEEYRRDISATREGMNAAHEHLQEQTDLLGYKLIRDALARAHMEDVVSERFEHLQEQIDTNAYTAMKLAMQVYQGTGGGTVITRYDNPLDWSKSESLAIPEPRCAVVNITGISAMPTSKTDEIPAVIEFWDMAGNYFKKDIVCGAQGATSMAYPKKNMKFDLLNEDGSEFDLRIGDWVVQDSYHLKAYYAELFRGVGAVSYKFWDEIMRFNGIDKDRPYKKALYSNGVKDLTLQLESGALCHPDGFPCLVYLNGKFYGIYAWQLKKHRKNYHLEKSNTEHIHLDGTLHIQAFFMNGTVNWTDFEIRNPNKLYTMDGKKYDGDAPKELIDETSAKYDSGNKDHVRTAKVKKAIQELSRKSKAAVTLHTQYQSNLTEERKAELKAKYGEIFDWENLRDYLIFSDVIDNLDGFFKNWQWVTYDGVKWYVNAYDLDNTLGVFVWNGNTLRDPVTTHHAGYIGSPVYSVISLYKEELEARYKELREAGIISTDKILSKLVDWVKRIGTANYELEYDKWPDSPPVKDYTDSLARVKKWLDQTIANMDKLYNYEAETDRIKQLEETVQELQELIYSGEEMTYKGAKVAINSDFNAMMKDVFDGDGTGGEALSEIPDEVKDEVAAPEEFNEMLNEIFG